MNVLKKINSTFIKFAIVGVVNTIVGMSIMFISYNVLHLGYWFSSFLNFSLASILSFFLNKNITFQSKGNTGTKAIRFALNIAICYVIAYGIAKPFTMFVLKGQPVKIQENIAMLIGLGIFSILNYFGQKLIVFK